MSELRLAAGARSVLALSLTFCAGALAGSAAPLRADEPMNPAGSQRATAVTTLSAEQRAALRAELAKYLRPDNEGVATLLHLDGSSSIELDGHHQHAMIARVSTSGRPELACFDDPDAALAFLTHAPRGAQSTVASANGGQPQEADR